MKTNGSLRARATWCFAVTLLLGVWGTGRALFGQSEKKVEPKPAAEVKIAAAAAEKPRPAGKRGVATTDPIEILRQGGAVMYPLLACSVVGLALFFERLVSLRRSRVIPKPFVQRFLHQVRDGNLDRQRALELCQENRSPVAAVFAGALRKWGRPSVEVEQGIIDAGERVTNGLRKYLRVFSALTVVAPLLGLLGTVIGMIETFNVVAETSVSRGSPAVGGGYQPGPVEHRVRTHRRHSRAVLRLLFRRARGPVDHRYGLPRAGTGQPDLRRGTAEPKRNRHDQAPSPGSGDGSRRLSIVAFRSAKVAPLSLARKATMRHLLICRS